ncbi:MAG: hypothetical protein ABL986_15875 [Vicinamibacterales bacterium]
MESNFNNPFAPDPPEGPTEGEGPAAEPLTAPAAEAELSPGFARFRSCRWQQPAEDGNAEFCTHREVKPYAGATNFDANAWCPDCVHYKLRRTPKKRSPDDYAY